MKDAKKILRSAISDLELALQKAEDALAQMEENAEEVPDVQQQQYVQQVPAAAPATASGTAPVQFVPQYAPTWYVQLAPQQNPGVPVTYAAVYPGQALLAVNRCKSRNMTTNPGIVGAMLSSKRYLSTQEITKNLLLVSLDKFNAERDPKTLRLKEQRDKPLVLILSWLQAKHKHLKKYAELYTEQGFDVLIAQITPWQLLWPVKGSQPVAVDIVKFLHNNPSYAPMVIHGFSVGGYLWGECMAHMALDLDKYKPLLGRIAAQIWDSAADITEIPVGVPKALFPKNMALQNALRSYMLYHLKTFHDTATVHYIRSSQMFHFSLVTAPALFLVSKSDPVGAEASNMRVRDCLESKNIHTTWKCWDRSPHVGHFMKHRDEYIEAVFSHLNSVNLLRHPEKIRAKL